MTVFVTRKVTSKAGLVELLCTTDDGVVVRAGLRIVDAPKAETEKK